jgi:hypothetical protein
MVQIQKSEKKAVYRYLLQEGVIVLHKDFTTQPHKGTNVANIHVRTLLRSLKDRGLVELVFNWQYFYYFLNNEGKKYLSEQLGLTEEVVPLTWKYAFYHVERTKRGNTNTLLRIAEEKSEERDLRDKDVVMVNLKAREEVEEEELVSKESQEKSNLLNQRLQQKQSQLDCLYINYRAEI